MSPYAADLAAVRAAAERIRAHAHMTPVMRSRSIDALAGRGLHFKCELLQRTGAFKFRGAMNAVASLSEAEAARGVLTHSSGNHGQAVALAAALRGVPATVVMPEDAPAIKRAAVAAYGARIVSCAPGSAARAATAERERARSGAHFIHPSDDPAVIAGQGTVALELLEQVPDLQAIIAPVGGGGLIAGVALAARALRPGIRVFAAEPAGADDAARSVAAGLRLPQTDPRTIADGLRTELGDNTWPVLRDLVEEVLVVEEEEIIRCTRLIWERMKLTIEPSAGVGVAAALSPRFRALAGIRRAGVVLSGGNVDLSALAWQ